MKKTVILFSSTDGHTVRICERIIDILKHESTVTLSSIEKADSLDLEGFDFILIGASIRYGNHKASLFSFIKKNIKILNVKKTAFFNVNAVARKEDKNTPETNPYLIKFLKKVAWKPTLLEVFAGKISYPKYHFFDKHMIRFIMWMSKGPTNPSKIYEFTDWDKVESFGNKVLNNYLKT
ncbi:MAG: menaquinone-dependent protoporphyrinogen IX dehydrogenase [Gammaproteobacteria bacterium TMED112]|nr:MAG: menaquinone-dependent protoporphyrinogen IX dehydrogenase [Gammaproteobacteria bacterium TMED112]|tara:strand:- start:6660 stop:7196 length:537 start_codon:yes stop_codon:yes gene_type:complete